MSTPATILSIAGITMIIAGVNLTRNHWRSATDKQQELSRQQRDQHRQLAQRWHDAINRPPSQ